MDFFVFHLFCVLGFWFLGYCCVFFDLERAAVCAQNMIRSQHASTDYHDSNLVVSLRSHSDCFLQQLFSAHR